MEPVYGSYTEHVNGCETGNGAGWPYWADVVMDFSFMLYDGRSGESRRELE